MRRREEILRSFRDAYSVGEPEKVIIAETDGGYLEKEGREVIAPSLRVLFQLIFGSRQVQDSSGSEESVTRTWAEVAEDPDELVDRVVDALEEQNDLQVKTLENYTAFKQMVQQELRGIRDAIEELRGTLKSGSERQGKVADPVLPESGTGVGHGEEGMGSK
jgi:hypothetical protein